MDKTTRSVSSGQVEKTVNRTLLSKHRHARSQRYGVEWASATRLQARVGVGMGGGGVLKP